MMWGRRKEREAAQAEAERALQESVDHLHDAVIQGRKVRKVAERLRKIQQENHFGPSIAHVYEGRQP